ncbi:MAG: MarR family transcriptional regulator [Steroidobacteraceae bacterium]
MEKTLQTDARNDGQTPELDEHEKLGRLIGEVNRLWRSRLNELLRPLGLSQTRWMTLRILSRHGTHMSQVELAARLGVEPPTLVAILDGLTRDAYIERRNSDIDRRSKEVHLTTKARGKVRQIDAMAKKLRTEIMQDLDDRALRAATATLLSLRERLAASDAVTTTVVKSPSKSSRTQQARKRTAKK